MADSTNPFPFRIGCVAMFIRSFVRGFNTASGVSIIGHRVAQSGRDESKARVVRMYYFAEVAKDRAD